ncbi:MAG TPA: PAS domain S-box protein [Opitutaceae bacterium]|nr:PAS domain S-box protein [Opitutaceae bacterium]
MVDHASLPKPVEKKIRLVLLEDNPADAELIVENLRDAGFALEWRRVEDAAGLIAALAAPCDVLLADYSLPQFGALAALRLVRERGIDVPVIVVSGSIGEERAIECIRAGAADYLLKDRPARLGHIVAAVLEQRELRRRSRAAEEDLRESEHRYRELFASNPAPMWVYDLATLQFLAVNDAAVAHYGYSRDEFLGMTLREIRPNAEVERLQNYLSHPAPRGPEIWRHRKKDGSEIMVEVVANDLPFAGREARVAMLTDVTEKKRGEMQLRMQATMLEVAANPVVVTDVEGCITWVNPAFTALTGYTFDEAVGQTPRLLKSGRHDAEFYRELWETLRAGRVWRGEFVNRRKDGTLIFDVHTITPMRNESGVITHFIAVMHDETQRRRAEEELHSTHAQLRHLLEHSPAILYSLRLGGARPTPVFVSENIASLFGWSVADALDPHWWPQNVHPEDREIALAAEVQALADGANSTEYRIRCRDGRYRWVEDSRHVLRDAAGRPVELIGAWADIDGRKHAEEARQASEQRFAKIFRSSPIAIGYSTMDGGRLIDVNEQFLEFFGYARAELVAPDARPPSLWADPGERERVLEQMRTSGGIRNLEAAFFRKDGGRRVGLLSGEILQLAGEDVLVWMIADITEKKKLESELFRAQRVEGIGRLSSGIAHDMNNILAPIMMSAPLLRMGLPPREFENTLTTIEASAKRGADLVRQLLIFSRGVEGERGAVRVADLIEEVGKMMRETFPRTITIMADCPRGIWPVRGDATQLHQVLLNLCVNARDAMLEGGTLMVTAENAEYSAALALANPEAKPGPHVVLRVADSGCGIPPEIRERIFDPFFTTKEIGKGTGLGLSTVHGIVKSHGGFVALTSRVGQGTTFEIYLPAMHEPAPGVAPAAPGGIAGGQQELILVVDDEESIRRILRQTLERHNYRVITANDGADASLAFARHRDETRLIITDVDMPFMDGANLVRVVRKMSADVKFILSSGLAGGSALQEQADELADLGVRTILGKPYTAADVLAAVQKELGSR